MTYYDERLKILQEQIAQKSRIQSSLGFLRDRHETLETRLRELKSRMQDEQADVDRLESRSLANFFYHLVGKHDEMLSNEKQEALEAAVRYDAVAAELESSAEQIRGLERELLDYAGVEQEYQRLMDEKTAAIKASGSTEAAQILELERQIVYYTGQLRELDEAINVGQRACNTAYSIESSLESAHGAGTWDVLGGGMIADVIKHDHLDTAQMKVKALQNDLRLFRSELADVRIDAAFQVNVDGFSRFADFFFDGIFADFSVMSRIEQSQANVYQTRRKIEQTLQRLISLRDTMAREKDLAAVQIRELVAQAKM